jgi:hypothetical protein
MAWAHSMTAMDNRPLAIAISASELVSQDDPQGELILLGEAVADLRLADVQLRRAAFQVLADAMSGDDARFDEMRAETHRLAAEVGADDRQVVLNMEVIGAGHAVEQGDLDRADAITAHSEFTALDHAHVAVVLTGQAVAGWVGRDRARGVFDALRRNYGIDGGAA